jgi:hypothetical protein
MQSSLCYLQRRLRWRCSRRQQRVPHWAHCSAGCICRAPAPCEHNTSCLSIKLRTYCSLNTSNVQRRNNRRKRALGCSRRSHCTSHANITCLLLQFVRCSHTSSSLHASTRHANSLPSGTEWDFYKSYPGAFYN